MPWHQPKHCYTLRENHPIGVFINFDPLHFGVAFHILLPETEAQQCLDCRGRRKPEGVVLLREVVVFPWTRRMRRITTSNFFLGEKIKRWEEGIWSTKFSMTCAKSYTFLSCQDLAKHFFWGYVIKTVPLKWLNWYFLPKWCFSQWKTRFLQPWAVFSLVIFKVPKILK